MTQTGDLAPPAVRLHHSAPDRGWKHVVSSGYSCPVDGNTQIFILSSADLKVNLSTVS